MASLTDTFNIFFWGTFGFFILKYSVNGKQWFWPVLYVMVSIILMYFVNMGVFQDKCGFSNAGIVFKATFLPWVFIFGMMVVIITVFPGWKSPFSNTLGYMLALLSPSTSELTNHVKKDLIMVKNDPLLFINQINMSNIEDIEALLLETNVFNIDDATIKQQVIVLIQNLVFMKELISEWVWFMLTGFVTISTSYNLLANETCKTSVEQQSDTYNKSVVQEDTPTVKSSRVYYVDE
jgi:hypothetical protein